MIINASVFATLDKRNNWYTSTTEHTIIQLHHVVHPDIEMEKSSANDEYPSQYRSKHVKDGQLLVKISDEFHEYILNEISRRDLIEYDVFS